MELVQASGKHSLLVGGHGCGKTATLNHYLQSRGGGEHLSTLIYCFNFLAILFSKTESTKRLILNGQSVSRDVHKFMQIYFHHRQGAREWTRIPGQEGWILRVINHFDVLILIGYTYGPAHNQRLNLFLEDLHLPSSGTPLEVSNRHAPCAIAAISSLVRKASGGWVWCVRAD